MRPERSATSAEAASENVCKVAPTALVRVVRSDLANAGSAFVHRCLVEFVTQQFSDGTLV